MTTHEQAIQHLAQYDPDFPAFAATLPQEAINADNSLLPIEFAEDVATLLKAELPKLADWLDSPLDAPQDKMDPLAAVGVVSAALFLLRTHIRIKRGTDGKWSFLIEKSSMNDAILEKILDRLAQILGVSK